MNKKHFYFATASLSVLAWLVAVGFPSSSGAQLTGRTRNVGLQVSEYSFRPKTGLKVAKGETITFTFSNRGKMVHEAVVGTVAMQAAHEKEMASMGGMSMPDEADRVELKPGQSKKLTIKFDKAGTFEIACHQPNHYKLGMKVVVNVR